MAFMSLILRIVNDRFIFLTNHFIQPLKIWLKYFEINTLFFCFIVYVSMSDPCLIKGVAGSIKKHFCTDINFIFVRHFFIVISFLIPRYISWLNMYHVKFYVLMVHLGLCWMKKKVNRIQFLIAWLHIICANQVMRINEINS